MSKPAQVTSPANLYTEVYGSGPPMLCLHGLGANLYSWRHFITPFSKSHRLILVDFRGCGQSPKPRGSSYSIEEKVDDIYDLILEENLTNLTLVGNSLGGAIALMLALRFAEQQDDRISKLILIDSAGDKNSIPSHVKLIRSVLGAPIVYTSPSKLAAKRTLEFCYYDKRKITGEQVNAYAKPLSSAGGRHALLQTAKRCIPSDADELINKVKMVTVPTLILWGREDRVFPLRVGELLHSALPNSTMEVIDECGHIPQEEQPDETIQRIRRFLSASD